MSSDLEDEPQWLERLRRSGISVDREGRFVHEGAFVEHEGFKRALYRWLDRLPDGRHVLRLDDKRFAYVDVEDTPLVARALRWAGDDAWVSLSDGAEERLAPETLTIDDAGVLRCQVRDGRLEARLATSAAAALAERIEVRGDEPFLRTAGATTPIAPRR